MLKKLFKKEMTRVLDDKAWANPDYTLGGFWGNKVCLANPNEFKFLDFNKKQIVKIHGWHPERPQRGDTLLIEGKLSDMMFEFVDVEYCNNPPDMFFADIKILGQRMKEEIHD